MKIYHKENDVILINKYEVKCCHGVNPEEKVDPQRFLISAELFCDFSKAAKTDDIDATTSYAAVCKLIKSLFENNCFSLLEKLSAETAERILSNFPMIRKAVVTVEKPDAPMKGVFESVGVKVERAWNKVYLSIGSSIGDRNAYMDKAVTLIEADEKIRNLHESSRIKTQPWGGVAKEEFINSAAALETLYTPYELLDVICKIEKECDRVRSEHWGDRTLDIDILMYEDYVNDDKALILPHPEMTRRMFVLKPLAEIAPYLVHPLKKKTMLELLGEIELTNK